ncbi:MAG: carboxypeptidase regulatory-like domain-containing protein [Bacteroides sp.]|nr:carboxypeptidase regulatory-like domain-containing protein [Bacteroides sp.]MCM1096035.1 carboxypeptidase regulatory-like domain-containing protein [Terasakiella sp.]
MRKLFSIFVLAATVIAGILPARALEYKQVGTPGTATSCNLPFYTMSKFGQGITIYKKDAIGLEAGLKIKSISFIGYVGADKEYTAMDVYIGNTSYASVNSYIVDGPKEGSASTTRVNTDGMTHFYSIPAGETMTVPAAGSKTAPVDVITFECPEGFEYTGGNIVIYINAGVKSYSNYLYFSTAASTSGINYRVIGKHRESGYDREGYSVYTKQWSDNASTSNYIPVVKFGYEGARVAVSATVTGKILSSRNAQGIAGATVKFDGKTMTTPSSGIYEFTVDDVDPDATYTLEASAPGFEPASQVLDIKAGGEFRDMHLTLNKIPIPADLTGKVTDKASGAALAGAEVAFNGKTAVTGADGLYAFHVDNIDDIPANGLTLTAAAKGYNPWSTNILLTGDLSYNIEMEALPALPGEGKQVGDYTITDFDYNLPFNTLWNYSATEMIYPAAALGALSAGEKIGSISYYGHVARPSQGGDSGDTGDSGDDSGYGYAPARRAAADAGDETAYTANIRIYLVSSDLGQLASASQSTDLSSLTPLYDGPVDIAYGGAANSPALLFKADFDTPYVYDGKGLRIIVTSDSRSSKIVNFALDPSYKKNAMAKYGSTDISGQAFSMVSTGLPVMRLGAFVPVGTVSGTVTDALTSAPVAGASVTLGAGEEAATALTDDAGAYAVKLRGISYATEYRLAVSCGKYNDFIDEVTFTEAAPAVTADLSLTYGVAVSGTVKAADTSAGLAGVAVTLGEESTVTDASGAWSIEVNPVTTLKLAIKAGIDGYDSYQSEVDLAAADGNTLDGIDITLYASGPVIPAGATDLSADGTANCYIVAPGSVAYFDARHKGNSTTLSVGDIAGARLVWQDSPALVSKVKYDPATGSIVAHTADRAGNALVAAVDAAGTILWSWHLWIVDYDPALDYTTAPNADGTVWTFMDRNLGATTADRSDFACHGMLYQWGRKDPFPGAVTRTVMNDDYTYEKDGEPTLYDIDGRPLPKLSSLAAYHGTVELSLANPMTFYAMTYDHTGQYDEYGQEIVKNDYPTGDWTSPSDDDFWGGESMAKTIYDPSPVGYKVPVCDAAGNTPYAWLTYADMTWDGVNHGAVQDGQWFPATGTRVYASGGLDFPEGGNPYSGLWIGTKGKASADLVANPDLYGQYMMIVNGKRTFKVSKDKRSQGMSLRCVREVPDTSAGVTDVRYDADDTPADVYDLRGVCVLRGATPAAVSSLAPGLYIMRGRKILVK